jgi:hypothetical protein
MIASIRYLDQFVKQDDQWLFAERRLMVNWTDTRPSARAIACSAAGGLSWGFPGDWPLWRLLGAGEIA